jgi:DNA-binding LacI/PurR family transcriptional regulator
MPATIKDIAAQLGISHSTVSRALSGYPYVNEVLRRRVHDAARELRYQPNALARGLKGRRTRLVGLIIPDLMNDFYASAATVIQATLAQAGHRLLLSVSNNDSRSELAYLRAMREERVEGLIWVPRRRNEAALREFAEDGVPVVEFARHTREHLDSVVADDVGGAEAATRHLLERGHQRIGVILGQTDLSTGRERLEGYRRALAERSVAMDDDLVKVGRFDRAWGRRATEELLDMRRPPTALFATSSELAVGALRVLDERGIAIPSAISLVGFGDPEWFAIWRPPITTVAFPIQDLAVTAASTLLRRIRAKGGPDHRESSDFDAPSMPVQVRLSCHLIVRASTAAAPRS